MYLAISLILIIVALTYLYLRINDKKRRRVIEMMEKLPGPFALPLIGNALLGVAQRKEIVPISVAVYKDFGDIFKLWLGRMPMVVLNKPEHVEVVLSNVNHSRKAIVYEFLHPWLGTGLLTSFGKKWHLHRKMLTPTFHFKILEEFMEIIVEKSEFLVDILKRHSDGKTFNIYPYITRCALDIICETAMGTQIHAQSDTDSEYVKAVYDVSEITFKRIISPWLYPDFIFRRTTLGKRYKECLQILHGFTKRVIQERRALLSGTKINYESSSDEDNLYLGKKRRKAFLDLLLEISSSGDKITDEEIREEVDTFMLEGHDTTAAGMNWTLCLLGNHPDVQAKVYKELDEIFQGSDRPATTQDLQNMKYLERVIKESLRLYPSVPFIGRQAQEDIPLDDDYVIPEGCIIAINIFVLHRNPQNFPNPEEFNPDNFLPENIQKRHPFAYVPFSAGPRNCIGQKFALMEEKTILSYILRNFEIRCTDKIQDIPVLAELILRPQNGINVTLTPRAQKQN